MTITIYNYTRLNPLITPETAVSDLGTIAQGQGTGVENLIEYAGRVCYRSTNNMGKNAGFIRARLQEGHADIVEHVYVSLMIPQDSQVAWALSVRPMGWDDPTRFFMTCPVLSKSNQLIVTASLRGWYDLLNQLFHMDPENEFVRVLSTLAPQMFPSEQRDIKPLGGFTAPNATIYTLADEGGPEGSARQRVSLIGLSPLKPSEPKKVLNHMSATFLIEGVSRSLTHQLVRHRLLSFSQESQRYVDLIKGRWQPVVPPMIADDPAEYLHFMASFNAAVETYKVLRGKGERKEDARFLLPNATETRLVASGPLAAWDHFFRLRKDSAAQWEIRNMADKALSLLIVEGLDYFSKYKLQ